MGLFLSIYKRQVLVVLGVLLCFTMFFIFSISEVTMFSLIAFGIVFTIYGIASIVSHLSTPSTFRSFDIKFFKALCSIIIGILCISKFVLLL